MKILLTNDDGYTSPGILALYNTLCMKHEVKLIAPEGERSAIGHGITLHEPIRMKPVELNGKGSGYAVSGTPVDCVKLGLFTLYNSVPDLVISGINPGSNAGINLNYSGTVGAAREAALNNIMSLAVSVQQGDIMDFDGIAVFVSRFIDQVMLEGFPAGTFLNINVPDVPVWKTNGIKITRQASNNLSKAFENRADSKDNACFWYAKVPSCDSEPDTDIHALSQNYISITPVRCDVTDYTVLAEIDHLEKFE
ncbi:MAG: 5'/3'-nucleotidase SurE [Proteobacteria bacterium]|nr:5'/3'-nucleotidase SurE [Pseudomonadota bacterium]MBU1386586.1 5'/3'-nucleotidase SurE [Pseudomonadota bacterium]MBU1542487.1 5'/3'-nucleotidase SurE [Pseudomonadota bacterium]MBU2430899.1 5'/3'-nucleotidase SurE [Pseudomonadota bacterium]MBU2483006.1 5'/3'-nucleotidase SurE [Pseudomonadota bacterium]